VEDEGKREQKEIRKNQEDVGNKSFSLINILSISFLLLLHTQYCLSFSVTKHFPGEIFVLLTTFLGLTLLFFDVENNFLRSKV